MIAVIAGPIASGKSALARAVAVRLEHILDVESAVIDLDLIYEMLDARLSPKGDQRRWSEAWRVAGQIAALLSADGRCVIAEGDFASDEALRTFEDELPHRGAPRLVLLDVDFGVALSRARTDPTRGLSRDPAFLSAHYDAFTPEWQSREALRVDTGAASFDETTDVITRWLSSRSGA